MRNTITSRGKVSNDETFTIDCLGGEYGGVFREGGVTDDRECASYLDASPSSSPGIIRRYGSSATSREHHSHYNNLIRRGEFVPTLRLYGSKFEELRVGEHLTLMYKVSYILFCKLMSTWASCLMYVTSLLILWVEIAFQLLQSKFWHDIVSFAWLSDGDKSQILICYMVLCI